MLGFYNSATRKETLARVPANQGKINHDQKVPIDTFQVGFAECVTAQTLRVQADVIRFRIRIDSCCKERT